LLPKRILFFFVIAPLFAVMMLVGAFMLNAISASYRESVGLYDDLAQFLNFDVNPQNFPETQAEETIALPEHIRLPAVNFQALRNINPNVVAWIWLDGTSIHYPVVQGADNTHYLRHLFDGRQNAAGAIFVDSNNRPGFVDRNTNIYGHDMRNGTMFAALRRYREQAFFDEHPWIFLLTPEQNYVIELVAGYMTTVESSSWRLDFSGDADAEVWIAQRKSRSDFTSGATTRPTDRFVTLSTCSPAFHNARYVVVGRLIPIAMQAP
jgi:sortase B